MRCLTRYDGEVSEPLVGRQGSRVSMREHSLEKEMATHSSTLALKIPWTEGLGTGYYPWGHKESGTTERLHFNDYLGLISIKIDWSDLLAVQGTLKSFLQHHNSKAWPPLWSDAT